VFVVVVVAAVVGGLVATTAVLVVAGAVVVIGAADFEHPLVKVPTAARTVTAIEMARHFFSISTLPT
jgi:hypothetical protein